MRAGRVGDGEGAAARRFFIKKRPQQGAIAVTNYGVTLVREFQVEVEADSLETADTLARRIIAQFPTGTCKLLSVVADSSKPAALCKSKRKAEGRCDQNGKRHIRR